jgi:hypothetical protein
MITLLEEESYRLLLERNDLLGLYIRIIAQIYAASLKIVREEGICWEKKYR